MVVNKAIEKEGEKWLFFSGGGFQWLVVVVLAMEGLMMVGG